MPQTLLLIGTRKGLSCSKATPTVATGSLRGPYCEGWPVYHAVSSRRPAPSTPPRRASGTARRSGAAAISARRGRTRAKAWRTTTTAGRCRRSRPSRRRPVECSSASRRRASSRAATTAQTWSQLSTLAGQPGSDDWDDPANQPPGHLGLSALMLDDDDDARFWAIVQGVGVFETGDERCVVDAAQPRAARRMAAAARRGRFLRAQARPLGRRPEPHVPAEPLRHAPQRRRRRDAGPRSPKACRATSASPRRRIRTTATPSTSSRSIRATAAACPRARPPSGGRATPARAGSGSSAACRSTDAHVGVLREAMAIDSLRHARPLLRHEHRPALRERRRGRQLERDRELPAGDLVRRGRDASSTMADLHLPAER